MTFTDIDLANLSDAAVAAALKAGKLIASYAEKEVEVKTKATGESLTSQVVTEVDLQSQEIILKMLRKVTKIFNLGTLGEESPDNCERFDKDYFWCIDPIDGTLPFIRRQHGYSVSIGLVSKTGEPIIGVILDPMTSTIYRAVKGQGAFRNGRKWTIDETADAPLHFYNDTSFEDHPLLEETIREMEAISAKLGYNGLKTTLQGGAALNACWVLEEAPACYFKFMRKGQGGGSLWDYAASACIYAEAGGWVTDLYGDALDLNRAESTYLNHHGVVFASSEKIALEVMKYAKEVSENA